VPAAGAAGRWAIDPAASVARFSMTYLVVATLRGTLGSIEGALILDEDEPTRSSVEASIRVDTLETGNRLRDAHLRSGDFFDVRRFPVATFISRRVETLDAGSLRVVGDLTVRDITKEVALNVSYGEQPPADDRLRRATFTASTTVSRRAFGLGTRTKVEAVGGLVVSDSVAVTLDISAIEERA
jgi:polyisoprenoid-binding protein YceI